MLHLAHKKQICCIKKKQKNKVAEVEILKPS